MIKQILRVIIPGILIGLAFFAFPIFILKSLIFIFLLGICMRIFMFRRFRWKNHLAMAYSGYGSMREKFRSMDPTERKEFFQKMKRSRCSEFQERSTESPKESTHPESDNKNQNQNNQTNE